MRVEIKHRYTGAVLYALELPDGSDYAQRTAVEKAVAAPANLGYADLGSANLRSANLGSADLGGSSLPSPTVGLLASWGSLSDELCADLMLFDASCHPDPTAFDRWAKGGECPYKGVGVQRAAVFSERRDLWGRGQIYRPYDLMARVLAEKCPKWTDAQRADFAAKFSTVAK